MAKRQIAIAHAWYVVDGVHTTAVRGAVVELPEDEEKRLDGLGALVPVGGQLESLGNLVALQENATSEHIENYLLSGNTTEIVEQLGGYTPSLIEKLLVAEKAGDAREALIAGLEAHLGTSSGTAAPVPAVTEGASDDEIRAFLDASKANTIADSLEGKSPDFLERVIVAEEGRPEPRKSVVKIVTKLREEAASSTTV